jgi:glycosyltransferase involved in cell wall biosynthesis
MRERMETPTGSASEDSVGDGAPADPSGTPEGVEVDRLPDLIGAAERSGFLPIEDLSESVDIDPGTPVDVTLEAFSPDEDAQRAALVTFEFLRDDGSLAVPEARTTPMSARLGPYQYLETGPPSAAGVTRVTLEPPQGVRRVVIRGVKWRNAKHTLARLSDVTQRSHTASDDTPTETIEDFVRAIPEGDRLIVLYTTAPPLGHPTLALRPNRLAKEYAVQGCWVVFFPFSSIGEQAVRQAERVRQYNQADFGAFLTAALKRSGPDNVFICSSFPDIVAATAIDALRLRSWAVVYEVRDDMEEFNRVGYSKWFSPRLEQRVCALADLVVTVSPRLARKMEIIGRLTSGAVVVPNAVDGDLVTRASPLRTWEVAVARHSTRTVGYIGHLTPSWFDWPVLLSAAERLTDVTFEIIGHGMPDGLELPENVHFLGPKTHDEFLEISSRWQAGLIPFVPSTLTTAVDPNKIYEYLAAGLRVVTAPMGAVRECPATIVYESPGEFVDAVSAVLERPPSLVELEDISAYVHGATWARRADTMLGLMASIRYLEPVR